MSGLSLLADDVPVAPIPVQEVNEGEPVYKLIENGFKVIVSPAQGGIAQISYKGLSDLLVRPIETQVFLTKDNTPWEHRAWRTSEGKQVVMLTKTVGEPHRLRIVHLIEVSPDGNRLLQTSRITSLGPNDLNGIKPFIQMTLKSPDELMDGQVAHRLRYATHELSLNISWGIQDPYEQLLPEETILNHEEGFLFKSILKDKRDLPPQGWTLLGKMEMNLQKIQIGIEPEGNL